MILEGMFGKLAQDCFKRPTSTFVLAAVMAAFGGAAPFNANAAAVLGPEALTITYFATNLGANTNCAPGPCASPLVPLLPALNVVCPGGVGATCTFYVHLESSDILTPGAEGVWQFLAPGVPVPGPVLGAGFVVWDDSDPARGPFNHSYAVVSRVTNTVVNENFPIRINLQCTAPAGSPGCNVSNVLANLEVSVFHP